MSDTQFRALVVEETEPKKYVSQVKTRSIDDLPDGDVLVRVHYSALNFKDALSSIGNKGVTRHYPHTPGIDAAGTVVASTDAQFAVGDEVIVTSYDLGMNTDGALAEYIRVPAAWVIKRPNSLSLKEAMMFGTAGLTAGLMMEALVNHSVTPASGAVLVTGATGGVGSLAVAMLSKAGYEVTAVTGKPEAADFLKSLGAKAVVSRESIIETERPMLKEQWAGVVDVVGGEMLASALKATRYGGTVTCAGLVGSPELHTTVFPFILRAVSLVGIDSAECPMAPRLAVWNKMASEWKPACLEELTTEITLDDVSERLQAILQGKAHGHYLVKIA
ncbi:YhdH/YhfP family quinone oxidoreductase [Sedimenticola sp.]|uniref:YhdH/YhfP family quinone oxidoreductase n=1 Tax=Sedimenticola sp. TaxID=1940285 RepID=UPI003D14BD8A